MTTSTRVCCSMTSLTQIAYASRERRQGRSRAFLSYQARRRRRTALAPFPPASATSPRSRAEDLPSAFRGPKRPTSLPGKPPVQRRLRTDLESWTKTSFPSCTAGPPQLPSGSTVVPITISRSKRRGRIMRVLLVTLLLTLTLLAGCAGEGGMLTAKQGVSSADSAAYAWSSDAALVGAASFEMGDNLKQQLREEMENMDDDDLTAEDR